MIRQSYKSSTFFKLLEHCDTMNHNLLTLLETSAGRALSGVMIEAMVEEGSAGMTMRRCLIGSSPPRCERRCSSCKRCEAVQVPISPQQQRARWISRLFADATPRIVNSRGGDDISNYKPMTWKCKCGDLLFSP